MIEGRMTAVVRVITVRSRGALGGCIFRGRIVDPEGRGPQAGRHLTIKASYDVIADVDMGEFWMVTGTPEPYVYKINGYRREEEQLVPDFAEPIRPLGENIVAALADNPVFEGVGAILARRLWETCGERLHGILDTGEVDALRSVLSPDAAARLVRQWRTYGQGLTLRWLDQFKVSRRIARKVLAAYGDAARDKVAEDPYRLLAFEADWRTVDTLARSRFGIADDDPRRLAGGAEESLYRCVARTHTLAEPQRFKARLVGLFAPRAASDNRLMHLLSERALAEAVVRGVCYARADGYHPSGLYLMERELAERFAQMARSPAHPVDRREVGRAAEAFHATVGYAPSADQMTAIEQVVSKRLAIVAGGAGTGKTTVLSVARDVLMREGIATILLAPSDRAAHREWWATGCEVATVASFINRSYGEMLSDRHCVIIDNASVMDVPTMHAVMRRIPKGGCLILAGDPAQIAPIGPGLVFHALTAIERLDGAIIRLATAHHRNTKNDIRTVAAAIHAHCWIDLPHFAGHADGVSILPCSSDNVAHLTGLTLDAYETLGADERDVHILCPSTAADVGANALNRLAQERYHAADDRVCYRTKAGQLMATGFRVGDPVVWTRNDFALQVSEGSLGRVVAAEPQVLTDTCTIDIDGRHVRLTPEDMESLALGYAITIHRSQALRFERVIVPVSGHNRALDNRLIYTAITRGERQVVLVGDAAAARTAVEGMALGAVRHVGLPAMLDEELADSTLRDQD